MKELQITNLQMNKFSRRFSSIQFQKNKNYKLKSIVEKKIMQSRHTV